MRSMIRYKSGDVVLIPFPFTDLTAVKQRPAVVLSSSRFNHKREDVIVAAITSHVPQKLPVDEYRFSSREQQLAGLPQSSLVKLGKIVTIDQKLIRKRLGRILPNTRKRLIVILVNIFQEP